MTAQPPKPPSPSFQSHVDYYLTVAAALETVETFGESDSNTIWCATGFHYAR
jgi:hypothetical protein